MGFSVSGSAALIFVGMFIAFGTFYSATSNGFERVTDAQADHTDRMLTRQNTAINVTSATWNGSALTVTVENTGASQLEVSEVDLLANNSYLTGYDTAVDGDRATDLWLPQETLTITVTSLSGNPGRVKIVSGPGVADTAGVS
ncbi:MAG: flagellin [Haloarculaceae archaeon]